MKTPPSQKPWLALLAALATPLAAPAAEIIRYTFDEFTADPAPNDPVLNTAPGAFAPPGAADVHGLWNVTGFPLLLENQLGKMNGSVYNLGKSVDIAGGDHIETNYFLADLNIFGNTDYTCMAWINVRDATGDHMLFGTLLGDQRLHLGTRGTNLHSGHWGDDLSGTNANDPGTWHHVTWQGRADGIQLIYKDGVKVPDDGGGTGAPSTPLDDMLLIGIAEAPGRAYAGGFDEVKVFDTLLTPAEIQAAAVEGLPLVPLPAILSITALSRTSVAIVLKDFETTGVVNPDSIVLEIDDGFGITPVSPSGIEKTGDLTTITYTAPAEPEPYTSLNFIVTGQTTAGADFSDNISIRTHAFPSTLRAGLPAAPTDGSWHMAEFAGAVLAGGEQAFRDALFTVANDPIFAEATVAYVNHADPDAPGGRGQFHPDLTTLSDQPGVDDNNYVTLARSIQTIAPGDEGAHTIHIEGDDGYGIRITNTADPANNPTFTSTAGGAPNTIDQLSPNTALHPIPTGNSNAYLVVNFPVAGNYLVEFVGWENGGGAFQEVSWVKGAFTAFNQSRAWRLMGDGSPYQTVSVRGDIPQSLIDELEALEPDVTGWKTKIWYGADPNNGAVDNLNEAMAFIRAAGSGAPMPFTGEYTGTVPTLNFTDGGDGDFPGGITWPEPTDGGVSTVDDFIMLACATIRVPAADDYTIRVRSDDGFLFRFLNPANVFSRINATAGLELHPGALYEFAFPANTGNSNALGTVHLPAGDHKVVFVFWERGGGANAEIAAARGDLATFTAANFTLIGDPVDNTVKPVVTGIDTTGQWTVTSTVAPGPAAYVAGDLAGGFVRTDLDAAALDANNISLWNQINFADPQAPGGGAFVPDVAVPFPNNTPADDNNFALGGEATINIPSDGLYLFGFQGDDGSFLRIVGVDLPVDAVLEGGGTVDEGDFNGNPGVFDRIIFDAPTGNSRTVAYADLTAGTYDLEFEFFENGGGAYQAIFGAPSPFAADFSDYLPGVVMIPIGVDASSKSFQAKSGGLELAPHGTVVVSESDFRITSITRDGVTGEVSITFDSEPGVNYSVRISQDAKVWTAEAADLAGAAGATETSVTLSLAAIINALGAAPGGEVFIRVEKVE